jgi:hypothetical protein|tara:strand:+ start:2173 stop:2319 length:147 start_codon:yes stop_codon:yes gene_type:complete
MKKFPQDFTRSALVLTSYDARGSTRGAFGGGFIRAVVCGGGGNGVERE